jgi:hypothetical protein
LVPLQHALVVAEGGVVRPTHDTGRKQAGAARPARGDQEEIRTAVAPKPKLFGDGLAHSPTIVSIRNCGIRL